MPEYIPEDECKQQCLFDGGEWWEEHWEGMPEFKMENKGAYRQIIVNFETEAAVNEFAAIIEQRIRKTTRSIWFPKQEIMHQTDMEYVSDEERE